jgi:hypothetical protein
LPAPVAHKKRLAGSDPDERDEKKTQVVVDALGAGLVKTAGRTTDGSLVQHLDLRLNAPDDKEEGFEHRPYYIRPAGGIKPCLLAIYHCSRRTELSEALKFLDVSRKISSVGEARDSIPHALSIRRFGRIVLDTVDQLVYRKPLHVRSADGSTFPTLLTIPKRA